MEEEEHGAEWGRCQLNEELSNIQKLDYQNYMNSQITLQS